MQILSSNIGAMPLYALWEHSKTHTTEFNRTDQH